MKNTQRRLEPRRLSESYGLNLSLPPENREKAPRERNDMVRRPVSGQAGRQNGSGGSEHDQMLKMASDAIMQGADPDSVRKALMDNGIQFRSQRGGK